jgi:hypothetical protein
MFRSETPPWVTSTLGKQTAELMLSSGKLKIGTLVRLGVKDRGLIQEPSFGDVLDDLIRSKYKETKKGLIEVLDFNETVEILDDLFQIDRVPDHLGQVVVGFLNEDWVEWKNKTEFSQLERTFAEGLFVINDRVVREGVLSESGTEKLARINYRLSENLGTITI